MASESLEAQVARLSNAFSKKSVQLTTALHVGLEEACIIVEGAVVANIKNDTGQLSKATHHRVIERRGYPVGIVANNAEHAVYYEFGTGIYAEGGGGRKAPWSYQDARGQWHTTRGMRPRHFMTRGFNASREKIKARIALRLKQQL